MSLFSWNRGIFNEFTQIIKNNFLILSLNKRVCLVTLPWQLCDSFVTHFQKKCHCFGCEQSEQFLETVTWGSFCTHGFQVWIYVLGGSNCHKIITKLPPDPHQFVTKPPIDYPQNHRLITTRLLPNHHKITAKLPPARECRMEKTPPDFTPLVGRMWIGWWHKSRMTIPGWRTRCRLGYLLIEWVCRHI